MNTISTQAHHFDLFKQGDIKGFEFLYTRMYKRLVRHAGVILQDEAEAASIVNDVFLLAWNRRDKLDSDAHIFRFVRMVSTWKCFAFLKSKAARMGKCTAPLELHEHDTVSLSDQFQEASLEEMEREQEERHQFLLNAITHLPPRGESSWDCMFKASRTGK